VEKLLELPDQKTALGLRDRSMLEVLYSTGLRVSELTSLRVPDLDTKVGCVRCIGKGDKERIVPVGQKALRIVEKYLREGRPQLIGTGRGTPGPFLFVNRRGGRISRVGVWKSSIGVRTASRTTHSAYPTHAAAQFCDAFAGAWRGFAVSAVDVGTLRYLHDADYTHVVEERC